MAHSATCGHHAGAAPKPHDKGIAAHVAIYLAPGADIWEVHRKIQAINKPPSPKVPKLTVEKIHIALGEIDFLADVHAPWGGAAGVPNGTETRRIGDWVNEVRKIKSNTVFAIARTSTAVCMSPD